VFRWIPRALLKGADALSKYVDRHDFSLRPEVFERVRRELGPWSIDRFAAAHNYKARFFNALFRTPGSCGADAFAFTWSGGVSYVLPPFPLIDRVLDKIERDDAEAVVVVPVWRSASFWRRVHSGAWQRRLARPAVLLDVDALVANPANAGDCFFGERFGSQLLGFRTKPLLRGVKNAAPAAPRPRTLPSVEPRPRAEHPAAEPRLPGSAEPHAAPAGLAPDHRSAPEPLRRAPATATPADGTVYAPNPTGRKRKRLNSARRAALRRRGEDTALSDN